MNGRWPSNFLLTHSPGCVKIGVKGTSLQANIGKGSGKFSRVYGQAPSIVTSGYADSDGLETIDDWRCVEGCVVRRLGLQSGESVSKQSMRGVGLTGSPVYSSGQLDYDTKRGHNDKGTAARFFMQADWEYEKAECGLFSWVSEPCCTTQPRQDDYSLNADKSQVGRSCGMAEWQIVCADVIDWAAEYDGPKFHALLADPSYALSKKKKVDPDTPVEVEIKTVDDLIKAYHSFQQWGDTGFMSKSWDTAIGFNPETWRALAEHLLPGGFLFIFASSRGWHRLACALEDAGLIIQPSIFNWRTREVVEVPFCLGWVTGQSFPKSTRIDTAVDKVAGKLGGRKVICKYPNPGSTKPRQSMGNGWQEAPDITAPATDLARAWEGHRYGGQILKNSLEPIICAQKPWEGKRLDCIVRTGAGSLWVDGGRIGTNEVGQPRDYKPRKDRENWRITGGTTGSGATSPQGRWPSNFVLCHSEGCERVGVKRVKTDCGKQMADRVVPGIGGHGIYQGGNVPSRNRTHADPDGMETVDAWECVPECSIARLDAQAGERKSGGYPAYTHKVSRGIYGDYQGMDTDAEGHLKSTGGASRFFYNADWSHEVAERIAGADPVRYIPKAARKPRNQGLDDFYWRKDKTAATGFVRIDKDEWEELGQEEECIYEETDKRVSLRAQGNIHSTVKPISLNIWLAKLLLSPKEYAPRRVLIPFCGTMSEGVGALLAGFEEIIGIDSEQDYCDIGEARMRFWHTKSQETGSSDPRAILKTRGAKKRSPDDNSAQIPLDLILFEQKGKR